MKLREYVANEVLKLIIDLCKGIERKDWKLKNRDLTFVEISKENRVGEIIVRFYYDVDHIDYVDAILVNGEIILEYHSPEVQIINGIVNECNINYKLDCAILGEYCEVCKGRKLIK